VRRSFQKNHYELGNHVGRTLFLREYASFISDSMITELTDYPRNMMLSIDIIPVAMDEAVSDIRKRIMSVESDITGVSGSGKSMAAKQEVSALALELFTVGSLNVFSHQTNINTKSRILCFDMLYRIFAGAAAGAGADACRLQRRRLDVPYRLRLHQRTQQAAEHELHWSHQLQSENHLPLGCQGDAPRIRTFPRLDAGNPCGA